MSKASKLHVKCDGRDIFIIVDGIEIAKRGHPGTPQAMTWVSLEPGWSVIDGDGFIDVAYQDVGRTVQ